MPFQFGCGRSRTALAYFFAAIVSAFGFAAAVGAGFGFQNAGSAGTTSSGALLSSGRTSRMSQLL
jgi:hypothetical protein